MRIEGRLDYEVLIANQVRNSAGVLKGDNRHVQAKTLNPVHNVRDIF